MNEVILTGCMPEFNQIGLTRLHIGDLVEYFVRRCIA